MTNIISKYLNPKNDVAFKHIFGEEKNKDILLAMLNAVLKEQIHRSIKKITFIQTIQPPQGAAKKQSIVDVLCQDEDGCQYIIIVTMTVFLSLYFVFQNRLPSFFQSDIVKDYSAKVKQNVKKSSGKNIPFLPAFKKDEEQKEKSLWGPKYNEWAKIALIIFCILGILYLLLFTRIK